MDHHVYWEQRLSQGRGLNPAREQELAAILDDPSASPGDHRRARDELILGHTALAKTAAAFARRRGKSLAYDELMAAAMVALVECATQFGASRGAFSEFALPRIAWAIQKEVAATRYAVWGYPALWYNAQKWDRAVARLRAELGGEPTREEIVAASGLVGRRAAAAEVASRFLTTLRPDAGDGPGWGDDAFSDAGPGWNGDREDSDAAPLDARLLRVRAAYDALPPRHQQVIRMRLGLDGEPSSLAEAGQAIGVKRERARQIQASAMDRLTEALSEI